MPGRYTHPETQGLKTLLEHDPELVAAAKVRVKTMLLLLCDLVNLELGDATRPHAGTPQQQHLRERARALFLSLGLGAAIGDTGDQLPAGVPEPLALEVQQFLQELHVPEPLIRQVLARIENPITPEEAVYFLCERCGRHRLTLNPDGRYCEKCRWNPDTGEYQEYPVPAEPDYFDDDDYQDDEKDEEPQ